MDAIKSTVKDIEQKMKQVKGLANVKYLIYRKHMISMKDEYQSNKATKK